MKVTIIPSVIWWRFSYSSLSLLCWSITFILNCNILTSFYLPFPPIHSVLFSFCASAAVLYMCVLLTIIIIFYAFNNFSFPVFILLLLCVFFLSFFFKFFFYSTPHHLFGVEWVVLERIKMMGEGRQIWIFLISTRRTKKIYLKQKGIFIEKRKALTKWKFYGK